MENKTILITGSTSGIGLSIAKKFASKGYNIIFNGLEKEGPQIAQDVSHEYKIKTLYSSANVLKKIEIIEMINEGIKQFGKIDVLVNNAGMQHVAPIEEFPDDKWDSIIGVNLTASFYTCKTIWTDMKKRRSGRIINIASAHGLVASEFKSAYVASKHGMIGLTKVLALEGGKYGITVNAICPGYVKTPLVEKQITDLAKAHMISEKDVVSKIMLKEQVIKEFTNADTIAELAFFLAGDQSKTITGASFTLDGGWTAH